MVADKQSLCIHSVYKVKSAQHHLNPDSAIINRLMHVCATCMLGGGGRETGRRKNNNMS